MITRNDYPDHLLTLRHPDNPNWNWYLDSPQWEKEFYVRIENNVRDPNRQPKTNLRYSEAMIKRRNEIMVICDFTLEADMAERNRIREFIKKHSW